MVINENSPLFFGFTSIYSNLVLPFFSLEINVGIGLSHLRSTHTCDVIFVFKLLPYQVNCGCVWLINSFAHFRKGKSQINHVINLLQVYLPPRTYKYIY